MAELLTTAIVLLYDVVGSTRLRSKLGDVEAERVLRALDQRVSDVVTGSGGEIVKGTGDGQLAIFTAAGDALTAAGAIHRAADGLTLRMGVSAGDIRRDSRDIYGMPAVEAARLCAAAADGEVLVSDVVRLLAGTWHRHQLDDAGRRELKGLPESVRVWSLEWGVPASSRGPLLVDEEFPFVGRAAEFDVLRDAWAAASTGRLRVVCLAGAPGVGKTRLAVEFGRSLPATTTVMAGRCDRNDLTPLGAFIEAFEFYAQRATLEDLRRLGLADLEALSRVAPVVAERLGLAAPAVAEDPATQIQRLNDSLLAAFEAIAHRSGLLLVLDDVQWADETTRRLAQRLVKRPSSSPMLIVLTMRDTVGDLTAEVQEWLRGLSTGGSVTRVTLADLTPLDVERLAVAALGDRGRSLAEQVYVQSGGNGFFTSEILRQMAVGDGSGVPPSIAEVVLDRMSRLPPDVNLLLSAGALMGLAFELPAAELASGIGEERGVDAVEVALGARLVIEEDADHYQFSHALVRSALIDQLSTARRLRLHRALAEALGELGGTASDIARHLVAAVPAVDPAHARQAAVRAAEEAELSWRFDHAAVLYGLALEVPMPDDERTELLLRQGTAWNEFGNAAFGVPMFRQAFELARTNAWWDPMARAALGLWGTDPWRDNRSNEAVELLGQAAEHLADLPTATAAAVLAQQGSFSILTRPLAYRLGLAERAWEMARGLDDPLARYSVLQPRWVAMACPLTLHLLPAMDDELDRLLKAMDRRMEFGAASREVAYTWGGDGRSLRTFRDGLEAAHHKRDIDLWRVHSLNASIALAEGRTDNARSLAGRALEAGREAWNDTAHAIHIYVQVTADRFDGEPGRSREGLSALADAVGGPVVRLLLAWIDAEEGEAALASEALARIGPGRLSVLPEFFLGSLALAGAAGAACALKDPEWMRVVYEALLPLEDQICGVPWAPLPAAAHFLGQLAAGLGDDQASDDHHAQADRVHERFIAPGFDAYARARRLSHLA